MPAPATLDPMLRRYLDEVEARLAEVENPSGPTRVYACTTALMPDPLEYLGCVLRNTTLNILAHSDGTHWRREDTGAVI